jgi:hypothetical protein
MIAGRHPVPLGAEHPAPGGHQSHGRAAIVTAAVMVEEHHRVDMGAHGIVERNAESAGHIVQLRMRADAGAAATQLLHVAFERRGFPADTAQHVGGEQPPDRPAYDQRFAHRVIASTSANSSVDRSFQVHAHPFRK